jgi:hypothetical protein
MNAAAEDTIDHELEQAHALLVEKGYDLGSSRGAYVVAMSPVTDDPEKLNNAGS